MTHTPDQKTRMTTLEWAMTFILGHHDGRPLTGPVLAAAALPLAQWVSEVGNITDLGPEPTPDFDADELPTIEIPGEVYVGGRRADGINPDEDDDGLCGWCDVPSNETHMPDCAGWNLCTDCGHAREIHRSRQWPCQIGCSCSGFRLNP